MSRDRFTCVRHFHVVVTSTDGAPTCRGCGRRPTPAEEAAGIKALIQWEEARNKGTPRRRY
jgi:hypothetical protein